MSDSGQYFSMAPRSRKVPHELFLFFGESGHDPDEVLIEAIRQLPDCISVTTTDRHLRTLQVTRSEHPAEPDAFELELIRLSREFIGRLRQAGKLPG